MPKTANKRAEARRMTRVQHAHQAPIQRPAGRRVPLVQRRAGPSGLRGFLRTYPWLSTFLAVLIVAVFVLALRQAQMGPWAPKSQPTQAVCNLTTHTCDKVPLMVINKNHSFTATIKTNEGDIKLALYAQTAPVAVNNFVFLARQHFYDGLTFDRVEHPGQVSPITNQPSNLDLIQGGAGGKNGGPGYSLQFDNVTGSYPAGALSMANESQFFISLSDNTQAITGKFTTFGSVEAGLAVAKKIKPSDKILSISIDENAAAPTPTPSPTATATLAPTATATPQPTATPKK